MSLLIPVKENDIGAKIWGRHVFIGTGHVQNENRVCTHGDITVTLHDSRLMHSEEKVC